MIAFGCFGIAVGEVALLLDLSNRLFGSYVRTPIGALIRIVTIVGLAVLLASPLIWVWIDPSSVSACYCVVCAGLIGSLVFLHFAFPYRWGITRVSPLSRSSRCRLVDGIDFADFTLPVPSLPDAADGATILLLSDLHCNTQADLDLLQAALRELPREQFDAVFHLGDFGESNRLLADVVSTVSAVGSKYGAYCVLGNHDYEYGRRQLIVDLLEDQSVMVLNNESHFVRKLESTILGLSQPWTGEPLQQTETPGFTLCLTHTPDNIVHFPGLNVALGFAGHTHGGKLTIPGFGAVLVPSKLGRFLTEGWFSVTDSLLYLTRGIGYFPGRMGNVGEICARDPGESNLNKSRSGYKLDKIYNIDEAGRIHQHIQNDGNKTKVFNDLVGRIIRANRNP